MPPSLRDVPNRAGQLSHDAACVEGEPREASGLGSKDGPACGLKSQGRIPVGIIETRQREQDDRRALLVVIARRERQRGCQRLGRIEEC